jgi:hypothetical protein
MRRRRWQLILRHPLTVGVLTVRSTIAFFVVPSFVTESLLYFFVRRNWFRPQLSHTAATTLTWNRQYHEQLHLLACLKVSAVCALALLVATGVSVGIVFPLAHRRGPDAVSRTIALVGVLWFAPLIHSVIHEAVRKLTTCGEKKVLDVDES